MTEKEFMEAVDVLYEKSMAAREKFKKKGRIKLDKKPPDLFIPFIPLNVFLQKNQGINN